MKALAFADTSVDTGVSLMRGRTDASVSRRYARRSFYSLSSRA